MGLRVKIAILLAVLTAVPALALTPQEAIIQLKEMQATNRTLLEKTDRSMQEQLKKSTEIKAQHIARPDNDAAFTSIEETVSQLQERKREFLLRHDFLNDLTNKFTSAFGGGDAREFIEKQTLEMAASEIGVGTFEQPAGDEYWRFLTYLSVAIRELPEQIENPFKFTEAFMNFSTISRPKKPGEFRAQRNYFNSRRVESGKPMTVEKVEDENDPVQTLTTPAPVK
ncbi:MAG: hypothetical protein ABL958_14075 [Bdellovibrionia bacterium]